MDDAAVAAPAAAAFLEIFGPVDDPDEYFYGDAERAAAALGGDAESIDGRIPTRQRSPPSSSDRSAAGDSRPDLFRRLAT